MIRAKTHDGIFILGLDQENINRLLNKQPIFVSLSQIGGTDDVIIMAGNTLQDVMDDLKVMNDGPLPEPTAIEDTLNA